MRRINEGTAIELSIARRGDDGSLVTPTTLKYRVDDAGGDSITAWTSLTPASITTIAIPAATNAILDESKTYEDRIVSIMSDEGLSTQEVYEQTYRVVNLSGLP